MKEARGGGGGLGGVCVNAKRKGEKKVSRS